MSQTVQQRLSLRGKGSLASKMDTHMWGQSRVNAVIITKAQGAPLLQRKEGGPEEQFPRPRSKLHPHFCTQLCKRSGNPSKCGITVFPIMSIPLGLLAAKTWRGSSGKPAQAHERHSCKGTSDWPDGALWHPGREVIPSWWQTLENPS